MLSATTAPQLIDVNSIPSEDWEGTYASEPAGYQSFAGEVYFATGGDVYVGSPWKTNGTAAGTSRVAPNGIPAGGFFDAYPLAATSNELFLAGAIFDANAIGTIGLWKIDGTAGVPALVKDIEPNFWGTTIFNDEFYFTANDGVTGTELWKSDGAEVGTVRVADINPNAGSSGPSGFSIYNGKLYFMADDGASGAELWKTDGTELGTTRVADIQAGGGSSNPTGLTVFNGELYFSANDGDTGIELWKTDGTELGTVRVADINPDGGSSNPASLTVLNGELYFSANDGATGVELWKTDGTVGNAVRVTDINAVGGSSNPDRLNVLNGELYFNAVDGTIGNGIWKTDGATVSRVPLPETELFVRLQTVFNGELYFSSQGASSFSRRVELWKTDGTASGTERVTYFTDNEDTTSIPRFLGSAYVSGDTLIFTADDGIHGFEPWVIRAITPSSLASIIGDLPVGATELQVSATPADIDAFLAKIADLAPHGGDPIDVVLNLAQGDYEGAFVDVPLGYRVIINGAAGQVVFHGASPALTLQSGDLRVTGVTFVNSTDAASIVVNGGSLVIRESQISETTGGGQAAIEINVGSVDLGTLADAGGNTLEVSGAGDFVRNFSSSSVSAIGNEYQLNGVALSSEILAVPQWMRLAIDQSGSGVNLVGAFSLTVTVEDATWEIGTPFPEFAVSYSGFVHGDAETDLTGELEFSTDADETSRVGHYAVVASGLASAKYAISFDPGTLEIMPTIVGVDLQPANLNIDQNGAISLVIFGASTLDVSQITLSSLTFAGVSINVFNYSFVDADQDGVADLRIHFHSSVALKEALRQLYSDRLIQDFEADGKYANRQETLIAIDGAFGQYDQEFQGSDAASLFLAGNSLKTLLQQLGIAT